MYIIFEGEVGISINNNGEEKQVAILNANKIFGERALETNEVRGASAITHEPTLCIMINKNDFNDIVYHIKMIQKSKKE